MTNRILLILCLFIVPSLHAQTAIGSPVSVVSSNASAPITIITATYGAGTNQRDVTDAVIQRIRNGRLDFTASGSDLRCDPAPGQVKEFYIKYSYNGLIYEKNCRENERVSLPDPTIIATGGASPTNPSPTASLITGATPMSTDVKELQQQVLQLTQSVAALKQQNQQLLNTLQRQQQQRQQQQEQQQQQFARNTPGQFAVDIVDIEKIYGDPIRDVTASQRNTGRHYLWDRTDIYVQGETPIQSVTLKRDEPFNAMEVEEYLKTLTTTEKWVQKDERTWELPDSRVVAKWDGARKVDVTPER